MTVGLRRYCIVALFLLVLSGCNSVSVRQDLTQEQANEIVAVLHHNGISAEAVRETGGRGLYRVETRREAYSQAVALLYDKGLPSEARTSFDQLVAPQGLIPNSREVEALRLDRARAAEIEGALLENPAIRSARVIVRSQSIEDPLQYSSSVAGVSQAGASAVVVRRTGKEVSPDEIQDIVQRVVPGIQRENIDIKIYNADADEVGTTVGVTNTNGVVRRIPLTSFLGVWRIPDDDYTGLAAALTIGIVLVFVLGFAVGWGGFLLRAAPRPPASPLTPEYLSEKLVLPRGSGRPNRENLPARGENGSRREIPRGGS